MIAVGFGVIWVGYAVGFTGYCWVRGYDLSFKQIVWPSGFYQGKWPPALITDDTVLIPGQGTASSSTASGTGTGGQPASNPSGTVAGGHGR